MNRSVFFLFAALAAAVIGGMMFFAPSIASSNFGMQGGAEEHALFRAMGALIMGTGIINFLVRHHPDSFSLRSILVFNILSHILNIIADLWGVADGALAFSRILPAQFVHLTIALGSVYYLMVLRRESSKY